MNRSVLIAAATVAVALVPHGPADASTSGLWDAHNPTNGFRLTVYGESTATRWMDVPAGDDLVICYGSIKKARGGRSDKVNFKVRNPSNGALLGQTAYVSPGTCVRGWNNDLGTTKRVYADGDLLEAGLRERITGSFYTT